jgi:hypothetical protein
VSSKIKILFFVKLEVKMAKQVPKFKSTETALILGLKKQ